MKKIISLFIVFTILSCNDGNFDVPVFDFTSNVNSCGEYVLYIANSTSTEVLALSLSTTELNTFVGEKSYAITPTMVNYRIFNEGIGTDYFCADIPPSTPKVLNELNATSGTLTIITNANEANGLITGYTYQISLNELLFDDNNERIFIENLNFGDFTINL
jgi:hypothetical protein